MRIAALQYSYDSLKDFKAYAEKITHLVEHYAKLKVEILLLPEYAASEMIPFASIDQMQQLLPQYLKLFTDLAMFHRMYICSGTFLVKTSQGLFNRAYFFSPEGKMGYQDKCNLTPSEVQEGLLAAAQEFTLFETHLAKIGICVCYDVEFPILTQSLAWHGANLILVPSFTTTIHGHHRILVACRARALENQCYVAQACMVGKADTEMTYGAASICSPIDEGFPEDGVVALGERDQEGDVMADLKEDRLEKARLFGQTRNYIDNQRMSKIPPKFKSLDLR